MQRFDDYVLWHSWGHERRRRVEPSISTLEKLATVFEVGISEFFKTDDLDEEVNLPLMQKIKMIDTLAKDEQQALLKMIDMALSNKRMKDNLQTLITQWYIDLSRHVKCCKF